MYRGWLAWVVAAAWLLPGAAAAQILPGFEVGPEAYYYVYREPNFVVQTGPFVGVNGSYSFKLTPWFITLNGIADIGYLNYKSGGSGRINGLWNFKGDLRALFGGDAHLADTVFLSPYTGIGYRVLFESGNGRTSNFQGVTFFDYDRVSHYIYVPFGAGLSFWVGNWVWRPGVEYDLFVHGVQVSYLSQAGADQNITNQQTSGYGARAEFLFQAPPSWGGLSFGPFVRYWNIGDSKPSFFTAGGVAFVGIEPHNNTLEAGATARFHF